MLVGLWYVCFGFVVCFACSFGVGLVVDGLFGAVLVLCLVMLAFLI